MPIVYLGLGSNLGDREANLRRALRRLREGGVQIERCSGVYETEPWGVREQPRFLNAVCRGRTELAPPDLLALAKRIEGELGRAATVRYGPRTIDIDILLYGDLVLDTPDLTIPHPRLAERAFVIIPLAEIAPDVVLPGDGRTARQLLEGLADRAGAFRLGELAVTSHIPGEAMYQVTTLDNHLRVYTVPLPNARSVCVGIYLAVGSRYESEEEHGASHFVEHMLFKGTQRRTARDIATTIERVGGYANASTGREGTSYYTLMTAEHLPLALDLLSDMLLNSRFRPRELERERGVIIEEINRTLDTPEDLVFDLIVQLEWPESPIGRSIAGSHETVSRISRAQLLRFMARHYVPDAAAVVVAGPVEHARVVDEVSRFLGAWAPGEAPSPVPSDPRGPGGQITAEVRGTEQAQMCLSLRGVARRDPDRYAVDVLTAILGDGMGSRLFQEIREKRGLAYSVDASSSHLRDTGSFVIYAGVPPERAEEALGAIIEQLDRMRKRLVSDAELERGKEYTKGRLVLGLETPAANAGWVGSQAAQGLEIITPDEWIAGLEAVTAEDVRRVARRLFDGMTPNLALVGPFDDVERFRPLLRL